MFCYFTVTPATTIQDNYVLIVEDLIKQIQCQVSDILPHHRAGRTVPFISSTHRQAHLHIGLPSRDQDLYNHYGTDLCLANCAGAMWNRLSPHLHSHSTFTPFKSAQKTKFVHFQYGL